MRTFNEFVQAKEYAPLAEALVQSGVDVDQFFEQFLALAEETNWSDEESINELWRGIGSLLGAGMQKARTAIGNAGAAIQAGVKKGVDIYQSAEHQGKVKDAMARVQKLKDELTNLGVTGQDIDNSIQNFTSQLTAALEKLKADKTQRIGPGGVQPAQSPASTSPSVAPATSVSA